MTDLARKLELDGNLIRKLSETDMKKISSLADKCLGKNFSVLKKENDIVRLAVILECAMRARAEYEKAGIDEKIYYDTMSDIKIWCENNGNRGLKNYGWLSNHVRLELFRIGRLQFQLYECKNKTLLYKKLPFSYGENLVYIHIPQGEKLCEKACLQSLEKAGEFFRKHFPSYSYRYYFCESWLLFEGNKSFMDEDSNIQRFYRLFDHAYSIGIDKQAVERIFGKRRLFIRSYPENTTLQKNAKAYMRSGGRMGIGVGTIDKEKVLKGEGRYGN